MDKTTARIRKRYTQTRQWDERAWCPVLTVGCQSFELAPVLTRREAESFRDMLAQALAAMVKQESEARDE
jgi:hypothetical protein